MQRKKSVGVVIPFGRRELIIIVSKLGIQMTCLKLGRVGWAIFKISNGICNCFTSDSARSDAKGPQGVFCSRKKLCFLIIVVVFLFLVSLSLGVVGTFYGIQGETNVNEGD